MFKQCKPIAVCSAVVRKHIRGSQHREQTTQLNHGNKTAAYSKMQREWHLGKRNNKDTRETLRCLR